MGGEILESECRLNLREQTEGTRPRPPASPRPRHCPLLLLGSGGPRCQVFGGVFTSLSSSGEGFLSRCLARAPWGVTGKSSHEAAIITAHRERVARWTLQPRRAPLHTHHSGSLTLRAWLRMRLPASSPGGPGDVCDLDTSPFPTCSHTCSPCSPGLPVTHLSLVLLPFPHLTSTLPTVRQSCSPVGSTLKMHLKLSTPSSGQRGTSWLVPCLHVRAHPSSKTADLPAASHAGHTAACTTQPLSSRDGHPLPYWTRGRAPGWSVTHKAGSV